MAAELNHENHDSSSTEGEEKIRSSPVRLQPLKIDYPQIVISPQEIYKGNLLTESDEDQASEKAISLFELVHILEEVRISKAKSTVFLGLSVREWGDESSNKSIYEGAMAPLKQRVSEPFDHYDFISLDADEPVNEMIFWNYYPIPPFLEEGFSCYERDITPDDLSKYFLRSGYADGVVCIPRIFLWNYLSLEMEVARFIDIFREHLFGVSYSEFTYEDFRDNGFPVFTRESLKD